MICPECGETIFIPIKTRIAVIEGLQDEIHFTNKPDEEMTQDEIKAAKNLYKYYKNLYKDSETEVDVRIAALEELEV